MRIAIFTDYYPSVKVPAARAFIHARAKLYVEHGHDLLILSSPQANLPEREEFEGIQAIRSNLGAARLLVESFSPDVIAIHFPYRGTFSTILAASLPDEYPIVAWIHGHEAMYTAFFGYHSGLSRLLSIPHDWLKLRYLRNLLARCASVVYVSNWMRDVAERSMRYAHPYSFVIANPVNTQAFAPCNVPSPKEKLRGVSLRSLRSKYGLDIAICAYAGLEATDLTIIGTGPLEPELRSLIATVGSNSTILAHGFPYAQVPEILRGYDYFVAPSRTEAQGLAMCEAMSCGLPVVATRVGGIPEFVRDGVDGYLVPPEDSDALRQAIGKLIEDWAQFRQMAENARAHMLRTTDATAVIEQELELLHQVAT